ncbi:hypothetical protein V6N13_139636 [Hibiscus sabdariffa]
MVLQNSSLIILCKMASVAESIGAVASSSTRIRFRFKRTLPRQVFAIDIHRRLLAADDTSIDECLASGPASSSVE